MGIRYFDGLTWDKITREERTFCAELYFQARLDPERFFRLLVREAGIPGSLSGPWDVAYEACFYRDFLHRFAPKRKRDFSTKRTFDLALFGNHGIIIIEAKAAEVFTAEQARWFLRDGDDLNKLLKDAPPVLFVALATETYFENYRRFGRGTALSPFQGRHLSWESVLCEYPSVPLLERACQVYERSPRDIVDADAEPSHHAPHTKAGQIAMLRGEITQREKLISALEGVVPVQQAVAADGDVPRR